VKLWASSLDAERFTLRSLETWPHAGSTQQLLTSLAEDAELVAFRVCQDDPRLITLADVDALCAMSHQTSHLGILVIRPEVEVQSALGLLALIKPDEVQARQAIRLRADLELVDGGVDHDPTKSLGPPLTQGRRIFRVDKYLFPFQGHSPNLLGVRPAAETSSTTVPLMSKMSAAFEVESQLGCIVVRDTESVGDVSAWDPNDEPWFVDRSSAIFAVLPGVEGPVRCEVWRGMPATPLPEHLFEDVFEISGAFQVEDPAGVVHVELGMVRGTHRVLVLVDDRAWPRTVQVVVDPCD
jgi:hypothetical protein